MTEPKFADLVVRFTLTPAEVEKLPIEEQGKLIYDFLTTATEALVELGFNPRIVAEITEQLGFELREPYPGPLQVFVRDAPEK
jgi:hypothetical protein